jgi:hypothetical protein
MWGRANETRAFVAIIYLIAKDNNARLAGSLSATCPSESVLPIRLRPDFYVVFEGYTGWAEH